MNIYIEPQRATWSELVKRPVQDFETIRETILPILHAVKQDSDKALFELNEKFDKVKIETLLVSKAEFEQADELVAQDLKDAIQLAKANIEKFHSEQVLAVQSTETMTGVHCFRKQVAIEKVGLYIPGGTAPLFSTVLMLAIPAKLAGCREIVLCTPPNKEGKIHPGILYAANLLGLNKVVKTGGAQAIAAMAYGTETVPKVHKIFGPGNQYVTAAKQLLSQNGNVAIDMPAGPSEVAVYADSNSIPEFIASDLLSQAEHGVDSQVVLVASSEELVKATWKEIEKQLEKLPRKEIAKKALEKSYAVVISDEEVAIDFLNEYAAEHLILANKNADAVAEKIINAGSVFIGNFTPESAGDYASGTNHTLPTNGYATAYSGVSLDSFCKNITFQKISEEGIKNIGEAIETMAEAEELHAHKNAVTVRLNFLKNV